jgi:polyvinyl alcohol dehydrogenase (cytochrome)
MLWSRQLTEADTFNLACSIPGAQSCPEKPGPDFDFGQPPILVNLAQGKRALVIGQKSGLAHAIDPDNGGAILWQTRVSPGSALGGSQWGSASDGGRMYVASSDIGFSGILPDPTNPMGIRMLADPKKGGGLTALNLATGERVWRADPPACTRENCSPAQSAAVSMIPGVVFSGSIDGHLRAFAAETGQIVWDVDTMREFDTVNGLKAKGGSLNVAGPVIAGGLLLVTSGYGQYGGVPGNVLLAFSVDGE